MCVYCIQAFCCVEYSIIASLKLRKLRFCFLFCSRETTPTTELRRDSVTEMESSSTTKNVSMAATSPQKPSTMEMPSAEEIEEFFSAAEKYEQERFKQK